MKPFYRLLWDDGDSFDYDGNADSMLEQIRARDPEDAAGYERFVDYTRRVFEKGYEELAATPFLRFMDMVRVAPELARLRADRSVYRAVARFVKNEHVRQALSFHSLLVGGNPFDTSSIYTLIHYLERKWGVYFPRGGTGALVRSLVQRVSGAGRGDSDSRRRFGTSSSTRAAGAPGTWSRRTLTPVRRSTSWCPTPTCTTPTPSCTPTTEPPRRPRRSWRRPSGACRSSCSTSERTGPTTWRTIRWCSGRATKAC